MERILHYHIEGNFEGVTIGDFLKYTGYSRHLRAALKEDSSFLINGSVVPHYSRLCEGDILTVHIPETEQPSSIQPVELPVSIVYEDADLFVVNKAAGMPIHPSFNNHENTLANAMAWLYVQRNEPFVYRCINRLDRNTSGLLILAKNPLSGALLSDMIKKRTIHRTYLAILENPYHKVLPDDGTIDAPIGRKEGSVIERCVDFAYGDPAVTHYRKVCDLPGHRFLMQLQLETGRTHQIRVHMADLGFPLAGDSLYNPSTDEKRQALHSWQLDFVHPVTGESLHFQAPLPADLCSFIPRESAELLQHAGIC